MAQNPSIAAGLTVADRQDLQALLDDFERTWGEQALATRARQLPPAGQPLRLPALTGLVRIDLERQWQRGRRPTVEGFLYFYPELGTRDSVALELILAEFRARQRFGGGANLADFCRRFPNQADALRHLGDRPDPAMSASAASLRRTAATPIPGEVPGAVDGLPAAFGRYQILRKLGHGGMGAVYLAHDTQLDRHVALKVAHHASEGSDLLQRFLREARLAATLSHPNLCPVFDSGEVNGRHFLTMAYVEGVTLAEATKAGSVPPGEAAKLVCKVALALQDAHAKGIIHRDLKPSNIMIDKRGEPVVMDFGLARSSADAVATVSGQMLGTPAYMPPEQVMGDIDAMGPCCDVYSLGVILYELLTGRVPFRGDVGSIMLAVLNQPPDPPSQVRTGVDPALDAVCLKALAKNPTDRFATMAAFAAALTDHLEGREVKVEAPPPPPSREMKTRATKPPLAPPRQRGGPVSPWLKAAVLLLLGLAVIAAAGFAAMSLLAEHGIIRIEVADPATTVEVDGHAVPLQNGASEPLNLRTGTHKLTIKRPGAEIETREFTVRRGKNKPQKVGDGNK
jgi:predicted Ser/Thr protein kinase